MGVRDGLAKIGQSIAAGAGVMITGRPFGRRSTQAENQHDIAVARRIAALDSNTIRNLGNTVSAHMDGGVTYIVHGSEIGTGFTDPTDDKKVTRLHVQNLSSQFQALDSESTQERHLPVDWVEFLDTLKGSDRDEFATWLSLLTATRFDASPPPHWEVPPALLARLRSLEQVDRAALTRWISLQMSTHSAYHALPDPRIKSRFEIELDEHASDGVELSREELANVADSSEGSIDHALAMMFIRLGPPPETTEVDYVPASNGGGGAQQ
ncbi:hypothetical protein [Streptomyces sp. S1]|uniref:hypothetical protein n=1 Tax=Streptomyces sp. S1 TaxID=718288 RepID=UPI003D75E8BE